MLSILLQLFGHKNLKLMLTFFAKDAFTETPIIPTDMANYILNICIGFAGVHIEFFSTATASPNHIELPLIIFNNLVANIFNFS
jgi:hypothetical protein